MASSQYQGQIASRGKGQTTCIHHKGRQVELYCEECQDLACTKCLSTVHRSHTMCDLSEFTPQNKQDINFFIDKTENVDLVQINEYITDTDTELKENTSNFEKLSHQLMTQTNKLKQDLDLLTAQTLSLYQQKREDNTRLLQSYKQDLEVHRSQLKQQVQECKTALQRGSDIEIFDRRSQIRSTARLPVKPASGLAKFTPNRDPKWYLEEALGTFDTSSLGQSHHKSFSLYSHSPSQTSLKHEVSKNSSRQSSGEREDLTSLQSTLLSEPKVLEKWESPCGIASVCPTTSGQVWSSYYNSNTLNLLNRKGKVMLGVKHHSTIRDISLYPTTNKLWICDSDKNITELVSGRLVDRFSTKEEPLCICITASNHVIVGMSKNISKFTTEGKLVLSKSGNGKPLVCTPYKISECPVTKNVAVADWDSEYDGGDEKPSVVVMDKDFRRIFVYRGEVPSISQPISSLAIKPFNPWGVVYDSVGNLVIGYNSILLISGDGKFLGIIHADAHNTFAVGVDNSDILWAVFGGYFVKQLQYRSK